MYECILTVLTALSIFASREPGKVHIYVSSLPFEETESL